MSTLTAKLPKVDVTSLTSDASKPLFAAVGVVDLTVEQLKSTPGELTSTVSKAQATAKTQLETVQTQIKGLPEQVKTFRTEVEGRVTKAQQDATDVYGKLAVRGEKLVGAIRRQPSTQELVEDAKVTATTAERAVQSTTARVENTATAAKKTAKAAPKAVEDASAKIG